MQVVKAEKSHFIAEEEPSVLTLLSDQFGLDEALDSAQIEQAVMQQQSAETQQIIWYTDKYYCAQDNISYPEFTTQHFSPNRQE